MFKNREAFLHVRTRLINRRLCRYFSLGPTNMLNLNWHDRNSSALGGFLHIKADLVHTTAGKDLWHLFYTTWSSRWVGFTLRIERGKFSMRNPSHFIIDLILWCGCVNFVVNTHTTCASLSLEMNAVMQCKPGSLRRTRNKTGIQKVLSS